MNHHQSPIKTNDMFIHFKKPFIFIIRLFRYLKVTVVNEQAAFSQQDDPLASIDVNDNSATPFNSWAYPGSDKCVSGTRISSLPPYPVVWTYFVANGYPASEARRFYKRFQVFGWNSRIIPPLDHWQEIANHWMNLVRKLPSRDIRKTPPNDTHPGSDNNPAGTV